MKTQDDLLNGMVRDKWSPGVYKREDKHPWLVPVKMPFTKINGFLEEFDFRKYLGWNVPISQVYVFRAEPELVTRSLLRIERDNGVYQKFDERIYLLDKYRNLVTATGTETIRFRRYWLFGKEVSRPRMVHFCGIVANGAIMDALSVLGEKSQFVRIIFSYHEYTEAAIVYKIPKNVSVSEWLRAETDEAKLGFKEKFDEI